MLLPLLNGNHLDIINFARIFFLGGGDILAIKREEKSAVSVVTETHK